VQQREKLSDINRRWLRARLHRALFTSYEDKGIRADPNLLRKIREGPGLLSGLGQGDKPCPARTQGVPASLVRLGIPGQAVLHRRRSSLLNRARHVSLRRLGVPQECRSRMLPLLYRRGNSCGGPVLLAGLSYFKAKRTRRPARRGLRRERGDAQPA
jgi:hypothetical protein